MTRTVDGTVAGLALLACLAAPFFYLRRWISEAEFKNALVAASAVYFVFATFWMSRAGCGRSGRS